MKKIIMLLILAISFVSVQTAQCEEEVTEDKNCKNVGYMLFEKKDAKKKL